MSLKNIYFKNLIEYKKQIDENSESIRNRRVISHANFKEDKLEVTKYSAVIELDWITNIEEGLVFVFKAIEEQRQFIRVDGEVVRIDKVKRTSRESVEHLSKNTNLITKIPNPGELIIPDKLYIVEKDNDYAVYENRFIHMLLTYLNEFVYQRLSKIKDKLTTFNAKVHLNKTIKLKNKSTTYKLKYEDTIKDDEYLVQKYKSNEAIGRIENILYSVDSLLQTPLMKEVSNSSPIKPPIVKTNILRMNQNFRAALALYEYISSYSKLGYEINKEVQIITPFDDKLSNDIALSIELQSFIIYIYGNDIYSDLNDKYIENIEKEKNKKEKEIKLELSLLAKRVKSLKTDYPSYSLALEKRNKELELENSKISLLKQKNKMHLTKIEELYVLIEDSKNKINNLSKKVKEKEIEILNQKIFYANSLEEQEKNHKENIANLIEGYELEIRELKLAHELEINELIIKHEKQISEILKNHELEIEDLVFNHKLEVEKIKEQYLKEIMDIKKAHKLVINEKDLEIVNYQEKLVKADNLFLEQQKEYNLIIKEINDENDEKINNLNEEMEELVSEQKYLFSMHHALKEEHGLVDEDDNFTTEEKFEKLRSAKKYFDDFYKQQKQETKRTIRKIVKEEYKKEIEEEVKRTKEK